MSRPIPKHTKIAVRAKKGATSLQLKDEMVLEPDQVGWVLRESVIIMQFRVIRGSGKFMDIAPHKYKIETNYLNGDLVIFGPVLHESELEEEISDLRRRMRDGHWRRQSRRHDSGTPESGEV